MDRLENLKNIILYLMADEHVSYQIPPSLEKRQQMMRALSNVWEPKEISEDFLAMQDAELQLQAKDKGTASPPEQGESCPLLLWQGDITRLKVDAIVNAANAQGLGCWAPLHNCIDNCIHSAAGIQLRKECFDQLQGRLLKTGEAMMTKGYNLPSKHVIHTVGPIVKPHPLTPSPRGDGGACGGEKGGNGVPTKEQEEQLAQCYRSCLDLAEQAGLESIAFCCISTGVFRFPGERAAEIAVKTVRSYPRQSVKTVVFNVFLDKDYETYQRLLAKD